MREIDVGEIIKAVEELCIKANKILPDDLCGCISCAEKSETDEWKNGCTCYETGKYRWFYHGKRYRYYRR
ncbi:MAG TPA: hypothetical protein PLB03_09300, partial [Candidatus Fimenecus sp.]|nr:hypothetical protein [Candidatus Fimenecus sp.]